MVYDIKRTHETMQTDIDTVTSSEMGASAVENAAVATGAITQAKLINTRILGGIMVEPSGSDLWIKNAVGSVMITGNVVEIAAAHHLVTAASSNKEKVGIVEASGDGVTYVKYGAEVNEGMGTGAFPSVDSGCIQIAKLFAVASGSTITDSTSAVAASDINNSTSRF